MLETDDGSVALSELVETDPLVGADLDLTIRSDLADFNDPASTLLTIAPTRRGLVHFV